MIRRYIFGILLCSLLAACGSLEQAEPTTQPTIEVRKVVPFPTAKGPIPEIPADDPRAKGDPNAPVTIIEYSDFECPFCQRHFATVYQDLDSQYIATGQVRYVFRNYIAVPEHYAAPAAAVASICAAQQEQFWPMHDLLFERTNDWNIDPVQAPEIFLEYAGELGLDTEAFAACQADSVVAAQVNRESEQAMALGASGTPSFYVGQYYIYGAQQLNAFSAAIEAAAQESAE